MRDSIVRIRDGVLLQHLPDGESVLLDMATEQYYGLNRTGTRMLELLSETGSITHTHQAMLEQFDAPEDDLMTDLRNLVDDLKNAGLIEVEDE